MSRRSLILLIVILMIGMVAYLGFLYINRTPTLLPDGSVEESSFFSSWNPFRKNPTPSGNNNPGDYTDNGEDIPISETLNFKMKKVSSMPIAGFGVFQKERIKELLVTSEPLETEEATASKPVVQETEFAPAVRYVDKGKGIIYQTFADKISEEKFSATVIPQVYEAYFGGKGESVVMRYLKTDGETVETFVGTLPKELAREEHKDNNEVRGYFLPQNITDLATSADYTKMFYLFNLGEGVVGTTLEFLNNKKTQVFDSPFTEWTPSWPNSKTIMLNTRPASVVPGYLYKFDLGTRNLIRILGGINGLTTLTSPSGKLVLYSDSSLNLSIYRTDTKETTTLGVRTLPEKCLWGKSEATIYCAVPKSIPSGAYPDSWYQGEVSFEDEIWKIDAGSGIGNMIMDPLTEGRTDGIDATKLSLDDGEKYLFFVNKKDSFLWQLNLK